MKKKTNNHKETKSGRTTIKDVAKYTGFSIATISRVLNNKGVFYSKETYRKIQKAAKELNYHPDAVARGLKTSKTYNIAFLEPWRSDFFQEVSMGIQAFIKKIGYSLAIYRSNYSEDQERININSMISNRVDGIIISSAILDEENIVKIQKQNVPLVIIEKFIDDETIPCVSIKNREISKKAVNYLVKKGHRKIGFIAESLDVGKINSRFSGYKDALLENNIEYNNDYLFIHNNLSGEMYIFYDYIKKYIDRIKNLTALFITSDEHAIAAMKALREEGLEVPRDISIIGFDGLDISNFVNPALTTITQPRYEMGYKGMELLFKIISGATKEDIQLKAELTLRESVITLK